MPARTEMDTNMKSTLEYKSQPAHFHELSSASIVRAEVLGVVITVRKGEQLSICAWCDPNRTLAQKLTAAGYRLTHGICPKHRDVFHQTMNHETNQEV